MWRFFAPILSLLWEGETVVGDCNFTYRTRNGTCSSRHNAEWGSAWQLLQLGPLPTNVSSLQIPEVKERGEPASEWVAAWLSFIQADLMDLRELPEGVVNFATPLLDLSNLFGVEEQEDEELVLKADFSETDGLSLPRYTLTSLLWAEFRRLRTGLQEVNPFWNSQRLDQESRQILIAEYQNIIITELLPLLIGADEATKLAPGPLGINNTSYSANNSVSSSNDNLSSRAHQPSPTCPPSGVPTCTTSAAPVINSTSQATSHSLVNITTEILVASDASEGDMLLSDSNAAVDASENDMQLRLADIVGLMADLSFKASGLEQQVNLAVLGGIQVPTWQELSGQLLRLRLHVGEGGILPSRMEEGREAHTLVERWREASTRKNQLPECIGHAENREKTTENLLVKGLLEEADEGRLLSLTFSCLLTSALKKVIATDGFWFDKLEAGSLAWGQIRSIKEIRFVSVLCQNLPDLQSVQPDAFLLPDEYLNAPLPCGDLVHLDLSKWEAIQRPEHNSQSLGEEEEILEAIRAAEEALLKFRKYEYQLFLDNKLPPIFSGPRAQAARARQSIKVQSQVNSSALFEFVTYEFMERSRLRKLLGLPLPKNATTTLNSRLRRKRQAITFDIVGENPFLVNDLLPETEERNQRIYDQVASRVAASFRPADGLGPAYSTLTIEPVSSSFRASSTAFASGNSGSFASSSGTGSFTVLKNPTFSASGSRELPSPSGSTAFSFAIASGNRAGGSSSSTADTTSRSSPFGHLLRPGNCFPSEELSRCDSGARYRTFSGWCNNLARPYWGQANTVLRRLFPAVYDDGISTPRSQSVLGAATKLPNPRKVSREVHTSESDPDPRYTLMVMQWGQLVDHDLTHSPMVRGHANSVLDCRACDSALEHPACFPIPVPEEDRFFPSTVCIPFTRSNAGQQRLGPREQINQLSAYLDASMVYGSDECLARNLREDNGAGARLRVFEHPLNRHGGQYKALLPRTLEQPECFAPSGECFLAGDLRVNEQPGLTCLHTVLLREHNSIADSLAAINPHWSPEQLFQESRRILIAQVQHITFNEFLPRVLGRGQLATFGLDLSPGYYDNYDPQCSSQIFNEFSSAAFRFGHSAIKPNMTLLSLPAMLKRAPPRILALREHFNNPDVTMEMDVIDDMLRGLMLTPMETIDNRITQEVTDHLFEERGKRFSGMDLVALNIQRGREHGIPGYNNYRELCKLKRAETFEDFKDEIPANLIQRLQHLYSHPDDVDLFPGMLSETRLPGAVTGPTLSCLIGLQFSHIRKCDRFWYETSDPLLRFTEEQLTELKTSNLAALVCRNMDEPGMATRSGMDQEDRLTNPLVDCLATLRHLNLEPWRESTRAAQSCQVDGKSVAVGHAMRVSPCTVCVCTAEGTRCHTVKVESCLELVHIWGLSAVDTDASCRPQCTIV